MTKSIAKIDNQFVLKSHYNLTGNEQKLILYLISNINPQKRKDFTVQEVKITELERAFAGDKKQWNSIYDRVDMMCKRIMESPITLPKDFVVNGKQIKMHKRIPWFVDIDPHFDEDGDIAIRFEFHEKLKDFLLQLSQYVRININDILPLRGKHSIRMYQLFKAEKQRVSQYKNIAILTYGLDELKAILGIDGKYKSLKDFRRRVIEPMQEEINQYSGEINIDYQYIKTRRKVTHIEFKVFDAPSKKDQIDISKNKLSDYIPSQKDIEKLTQAQYNAYQILINYNVKEGIAYRQIIPTIQAGEMKGFEDLFVKNTLSHFTRNTNLPNDQESRAGAFVNWWIQKKIFDHNGNKNSVYWKLVEKVHEEKKVMSVAKREARYQSIGLPYKEFQKQYNDKSGAEQKDDYRNKVLHLSEKFKSPQFVK